MPGMITRCPKCSTAFRISENHLKSAQGMVRCGSCLNVFNAKANLEQNTPKAQKVKKKTASDDKKTVADSPPPSPEKKPAKQTPKHNNLFETEVKEPSASFETDDDDEAWALALLRDEGEAEEKAKPKTAPKSKFVEEPAPPKTDSHKQNHKIESNEPENPAQSSLDDFDVPLNPAFETGPEDPLASNSLASKQGTPEDNSKTSDPERPADFNPALEATSNPEGDKADPAKENAVEPDQALDIAETPAPAKPFLPELGDREWPIELEESDDTDKPKKTLWWALCLIGAIALFAQIAWLQFHKLNKTEPYRSFYAYACQALGCKLPDLVDLNAIETTNLIVRSHPSQSGALVLDVIIKNNAAFEQPFPALALIFTDIDNQAIAARSFTPDEYLGGELAGMNLMPVLQPVHIALTLKDPGQAAVGYKIEVSGAK